MLFEADHESDRGTKFRLIEAAVPVVRRRSGDLFPQASGLGHPATSAIPRKRPLTASLRAYSLVPVRAYVLAGELANRPFRIDLTCRALPRVPQRDADRPPVP